MEQGGSFLTQTKTISEKATQRLTTFHTVLKNLYCTGMAAAQNVFVIMAIGPPIATASDVRLYDNHLRNLSLAIILASACYLKAPLPLYTLKIGRDL